LIPGEEIGLERSFGKLSSLLSARGERAFHVVASSTAPPPPHSPSSSVGRPVTAVLPEVRCSCCNSYYVDRCQSHEEQAYGRDHNPSRYLTCQSGAWPCSEVQQVVTARSTEGPGACKNVGRLRICLLPEYSLHHGFLSVRHCIVSEYSYWDSSIMLKSLCLLQEPNRSPIA
jgi:hypothetical protein